MGLSLRQIKEDLKRIRKKGLHKLELRLVVLAECEQSKNRLRVLIKHSISERTYYRWRASYIRQGVEGLNDLKGRGRKRNVIRGRLASKVRNMRRLYEWGAEVICAHLDWKISRYKVNRYLKDKGFIKNKSNRRKKSGHTKIVVVHDPGAFTQVDVKHLTELSPDKRAYAYNFVDHASKWSYKRVYDSYGPYETTDFMERVIAKAPFKILKVQTDNGVEFTNKFISDPVEPIEHALDKLCKKKNIVHKLIPVGEKEVNGLVEKHHHIDWKEFYRKEKNYDLELINRRLEKHCEWRNQKRKFKSLGWITPCQFIENYKNNSNLISLESCYIFKQAA